MMNLLKKNMVVVLVIVLAVAGLVVYLNFFAGSSTAELTSTTPGGDSPISQDLILVLSNLHTIRLDNSIFTDPLFVSLTSNGVDHPPESVGRRNPFLPAGAATPPAGQTQTQTNKSQ